MLPPRERFLKEFENASYELAIVIMIQEVRNPLSAIIGYSRLLESGAISVEEVTRIIEEQSEVILELLSVAQEFVIQQRKE